MAEAQYKCSECESFHCIQKRKFNIVDEMSVFSCDCYLGGHKVEMPFDYSKLKTLLFARTLEQFTFFYSLYLIYRSALFGICEET